MLPTLTDGEAQCFSPFSNGAGSFWIGKYCVLCVDDLMLTNTLKMTVSDFSMIFSKVQLLELIICRELTCLDLLKEIFFVGNLL